MVTRLERAGAGHSLKLPVVRGIHTQHREPRLSSKIKIGHELHNTIREVLTFASSFLTPVPIQGCKTNNVTQILDMPAFADHLDGFNNYF